MPFDEAAALLMTYGTSQHALKDRAQLRAGETLLVLGAAGGVGLAAVELGKAMGARVIAAASSAEKLALAREHGADEGVQYPAGPLDKSARPRAHRSVSRRPAAPEGAQVIYDGVGGDYTEAALRAIGWQGRHLVVGFTAGIPKLPLNLPLLKSCQIVGVFWGEFTDPLSGAARGQRRGADGAVSRGPHQAGGHRTLSRWRAAREAIAQARRARRRAVKVVRRSSRQLSGGSQVVAEAATSAGCHRKWTFAWI